MGPVDAIVQVILRPKSRTMTTALFLGVPVLFGVLVVRIHCTAHWPGGLLWGMAALSVGAIVGFLFGIPRVLQSDARAAESQAGSGAPTAPAAAGYRVEVNTNLEQISDWLTKIIVGVGLINVSKLSGYMIGASRYVGASFGPDPAHAHFACALLLYFSVMGFAFGYLLTRLYLTGAFVAADRAATSPQQFRNELEREVRAADPTSKGLPSDSQVAAAERLGRFALGVDEPVLRSQVENLARDYERTRSSMRAGPDRINRLDELVVRMRTLGMAARFLLPELTASSSPGMRLVAIALLEVTADRQYLGWLTDRFKADAERPFVVYHAAIALCTAVTQLEPAEAGPHLERARTLAAQLKRDPPRNQILDQAARNLEAKRAARRGSADPPGGAAGGSSAVAATGPT